MSDWPQKFLHAFSELHHYESISAAYDLSLDDAYDVQHQFVSLRKEPVTGFKAALTAPQAQQVMGISEPIVGVLFSSGDFPAKRPLKLNKQALLETELGFKAAGDITSAVTPDNVFDHISTCLPMIEVASPNLATKPNGLDLVATNAASYGYITGAESALDTSTIDQLHVSLNFEGAQLQAGISAEVLGSQRTALVWLINQVLQRGYNIAAGHLFMTGAIGGMQPAKPGNYRAEFGDLGNIEFEISA
jgi:2-keto-4-pentenoate hydratase